MELKRNKCDIEDIIKCSHGMLRHAEAGEWETVAEAEVVRRALIHDFFVNPSSIASEPRIVAAIQELLQVNAKLERLSAVARDEAKAKIHSIKTGRTAINAYRANAK